MKELAKSSDESDTEQNERQTESRGSDCKPKTTEVSMSPH